MKKIIWITLFVFVMGNAMGCQKKEEQPVQQISEEEAAATIEETQEPSATEKIEEPGEENVSEAEDTSKQASTDNGQPATEGRTEDGRDTQTDVSLQSYYGKWKVTQYYAPYITAITTEEMNTLIGAECEYGPDVFISRGNDLVSPHYSESEETKADFEAAWKNQITFELLGIKADTIKQIFIDNANDNTYDFGSMFYIRDNNTIMIMYEGVFFEAIREE